MFLMELGYNVQDPILLYGNNKGSVDLTLNPVTGRKLKHIPIKYHVIRDYVEHEQIKLIHTSTVEMLANSLTKSFTQTKLKDFISGLGLI